MAEHRWSILCHRACVDKNSNMLSILDVTDEQTIDTITQPPEDALLVVRLQLVSMWARTSDEIPEKIWVAVTLNSPDGQEHLREQKEKGELLEGNLEAHKRVRLIFGVPVIPFRGPGKYWFNVYATDNPDKPTTLVCRVPMELNMKPASVSPTSQEQPSGHSPAAPRE